MNIYKARLSQVRALMKKRKIDAYIILNTDPHLENIFPTIGKLFGG